MDKFKQAFQDNFYLTEEYAVFCSKITGMPLKRASLGGQTVFLLKNKNISIGYYSEDLCLKFKKEKISYCRILPEINEESKHRSLIEYSVFHKTAYPEALKNYKRSFSDGLKAGKKFPHGTKIIRQPEEEDIKKIYAIYSDQMKRLNSYFFPVSFFKEFFQCPSSLLFLIESEKEIIAYFCCFQYGENIFVSIGGGNPRYFYRRCSNKLYDELIKYACQNKLNIHLGIGEYGSGYQIFKKNAGAVSYRTERYPDYENLLRLAFPLLRLKITGKSLALLSKLFPLRIIYLIMPFT